MVVAFLVVGVDALGLDGHVEGAVGGGRIDGERAGEIIEAAVDVGQPGMRNLEGDTGVHAVDGVVVAGPARRGRDHEDKQDSQDVAQVTTHRLSPCLDGARRDKLRKQHPRAGGHRLAQEGYQPTPSAGASCPIFTQRQARRLDLRTASNRAPLGSNASEPRP